MIQSNSQQTNYFASSNPSNFPTNFSLTRTNSPALELSRLLADFPNNHQLQEFTPYSSCISNNSTSDEAEEHQLSIHDERKQRRMISNRESARRSRMRKQRHLDELWSQVLRLRSDNHNLIEKMNEMSESHDRVVQENARLKEEAANLQRKLMDVQVSNSYSIFSDLDELSCNSAHLQAESSNQSLTPPTDLLH
ncbi:basic leucine zipper 43-like [Salvia miltiorrhiza]|uniref:basic leucine zipper 43-like n=1 Tax=Salvia miltiorrhiza TaxID=226208 RepID=UPI0025ACA156|nr:basic leucine zipper 43-like [Salvia miltiorrhiza]